MEKIDIALAADGGYFCGLFVTACSIAKYANKDARLRFNILDGGIGEEDWVRLETTVLRYHGESELRRFKITGEMFKDFLLWHGNHMTYARLLLPDLLSDADYCIYCDVDFLWMRDIAELWDERRDDVALISTWDGAQSTWNVDGGWMRDNGFDFSPDDYFCAGLTFFNLRYFREHGLAKRCFELLRLKPPFNDQTVLYIATKGKTQLVNLCWQRIHQYITPGMVKEGCVIHYAGAIPWKTPKGACAMMRDLDLLWHRMNAEARGITVWQSLRRHMGVGQIVYHRGLRDVLYWLNRIHCLGWLKWLLRKTNHGMVWESWEMGMARMV